MKTPLQWLIQLRSIGSDYCTQSQGGAHAGDGRQRSDCQRCCDEDDAKRGVLLAAVQRDAIEAAAKVPRAIADSRCSDWLIGEIERAIRALVPNAGGEQGG